LAACGPPPTRIDGGVLHRLRPSHHRLKVDVFSMIFRFGLGPDLPHSLDPLAGQAQARLKVDAMILYLGLIPTDTCAKDEAAIREIIDRCDALRRLDWIALGKQYRCRLLLSVSWSQRQQHRSSGTGPCSRNSASADHHQPGTATRGLPVCGCVPEFTNSRSHAPLGVGPVV
jgi:hypothetical protein